MVQINYSYRSSSSSSSSFSSSSSNNRSLKIITFSRPSRTNSIRKPTRKPITKQFIAPLPPTPQKVYNVKPSEFKQTVHMLTSTPEFQSPTVRRLKDIAPPPLNLPTISKPSPSSAGGETANIFISKPHVITDYFESLSPLGLNLSPASRSYDPFGVAAMSPLGLNLSPSSLSWCCSVLLSPSNRSGFDQSPIL